ncbi:EAL domain-containing protein [Massilia soli]|uniref:EAL domain-containing protein n=1 Tax=Massilia soli TaxID=2792854 RepID=A0ABS7SUD7_9BURK|nr:EAL domain-containing protein [Massilia soli]MBZ2209566.1 EAL domain-containing protein [Massilia soli]
MITAQDIEAGLGARQFQLYYQPKFSMAHGEVCGSEALVRWCPPDGSVIEPGAFLPLTHSAGLSPRMSAYIVARLFEDMAVLGPTRFAPVSFNTVATDFEDDALSGQIFAGMAATGTAPASLEIEITEHHALSCSPRVLANIRRLREAGLGLVMDDYGLGYSSVDTLSKWPFTSIKLDQGLVQRMLNSDKNAGIVRSAIRMAHELDIGLVAEGVETAAQYHFLVEAGCMKMQGYLISRPLALAALIAHERFAPCPVSMAVGLVQMAIVDHIQWRRKMVAYTLRHAGEPADSPQRAATDFPTLNCDKCQIGRWYRNEGATLAGSPTFALSERAHRRLHAIGAELVERMGQGADLEQVRPMLGSLQQTSLELLGSLLSLEDHGLATIYASGKPAPEGAARVCGLEMPAAVM